MLPHDLRFLFSDYFDERGRARPGCCARIEGHAHTSHADGYSPARDCVRRALELGLDTLAFAEHMRRGAPWRDAYFEEVEALRDEYRGRLRILCGIEVTALRGPDALDTDPESLERADFVAGSVHGLWAAAQGMGIDPFHRPGAHEALDGESELLRSLAVDPRVHVIGHPFGAYYERHGCPPAHAVLEIARLAADNGKAIEINVRHMDAGWFARCLAQAGPGVLFWPASDAHLARHVGRAASVLFPDDAA
jgi:histidinol phosphatase-like PHP family hydrolase